MPGLTGSPGPVGRDTLLAAGSCLLLVVDMQNDFCHQDGAKAELGRVTEPSRRARVGARRHAERVVPVVVSDATATEERAAHEAALRDIAGHMGYAATTAELLALWGLPERRTPAGRTAP